MSLKQIDKFVNESIELNWEWQAIHILGGEPTLHPQFFKLLDIIKRYKDFNPNCYIELWTNGCGEKVNKILSKLPPWIKEVSSEKTSNDVKKFHSYNIAPIDLKKYKKADFTKGCWITEICGIGLTRYGYYPCGAGAAVDRIFGFNIGIKTLLEVNDINLRCQLNLLCRYCGHFKEPPKALLVEEKMSASWIKAYDNYKKKIPEMSLY
jgi:sulfatase maturation enzyme AslB (radical SAM superfamily)